MSSDDIMPDLGRKVPRRVIDDLFSALGPSAMTVTIAPLQADGVERWVGYWDSASRCWARAGVVDDSEGRDYTKVEVRVADFMAKERQGCSHSEGDEAGVEMLVEEGGVIGRQTISLEGIRAVGEGVTVEQAEAAVREFNREHPGIAAMAGPGLEARRRRYEARKLNDFYTPTDEMAGGGPEGGGGQGHCRSCHHECEFEGCRTEAAVLKWGRCLQPICAHTAGCPSC